MPRSQKGSKFERDVCTQLSLWWTGGRRDDVFWRSSGSGARATGRAKRGRQTRGQYGDICATHKSGEPLLDLICFELKRGYTHDTFAEMFDKPDKAKPPAWEQWIAQAYRSWDQSGAYSWMLVVKRDRREALIVMPVELGQELTLVVPKPYLYPTTDLSFQFTGDIRLGNESRFLHLFGTPLSRLLENVQPSLIKQLVKQL